MRNLTLQKAEQAHLIERARFCSYPCKAECTVAPAHRRRMPRQGNLVLMDKRCLTASSSFMLTSGSAAEHLARNGACVALLSGAVNNFVLAAAQEFKQDQRVNVISLGLVENSWEGYGELLLGYNLVPMGKLRMPAQLLSVGAVNGRIL
jgi:hypothetical protein